MNNSLPEISFYGATDVGRMRNNNEDNYIAERIWNGRYLLLAAIDGIGGYEGGEVAAKIARDVIIDKITPATSATDCLTLLKQAVTDANNEIVRHKAADPQRSQMGCVISSAIIAADEKRLYMVHVGDSRLYQYTPSEGLKKLSHDHSLVGYREENGMLTEEQAMNHPQRNIIERSLGDDIREIDSPQFLDAAIFPILTSSQFLFCSDGLSDMLYSRQIAAALATDRSPREEVITLINEANKAGGKDNITAVIAKVVIPVNIELSSPDDNDDDLIMPEQNVPAATAIPPATRQKPVNTAPPESGGKSGRNLKKRISAFAVTIAVSFIAGGTAGYFIGRYTAAQEIEKTAAAPEIIPDSVITVTNNPTDTIADSTRVGQELADSLNKAAARQNAASLESQASKQQKSIR